MVTNTEENIVKHYRHKQVLLRIICAVIILISGIAIGAGGTILLAKHRVIWIGHPHKKDAAAITKKISTKYGLTQEQTKQVEQILNKAFQQRELHNKEMDKKRDADTQIIIAEMNDVLTPAQFERWNKDFQAMREKFKNRFKQSDKK
jgi:transcriptional regulator of heat shock response